MHHPRSLGQDMGLEILVLGKGFPAVDHQCKQIHNYHLQPMCAAHDWRDINPYNGFRRRGNRSWRQRRLSQSAVRSGVGDQETGRGRRAVGSPNLSLWIPGSPYTGRVRLYSLYPEEIRLSSQRLFTVSSTRVLGSDRIKPKKSDPLKTTFRSINEVVIDNLLTIIQIRRRLTGSPEAWWRVRGRGGG